MSSESKTGPSPSENVSDTIVGLIASVAGGKKSGLHEPMFMGREKEYLAECIDSGFVSSVGPFVERFENELAEFVGAERAIAVVNGTSALHLALVGLGICPGDEVIVPAMSFVATASSVVLAGAVPHFVDISPTTWGIDPDDLREYLRKTVRVRGGQSINTTSGRPVTAVVPMHTLGHPSDVRGIKGVADEFGLVVLEDAAESLGSYVGDAHTGLAGAAGVFSFNGNKTITTGGGGAIVTNDTDLASKLKHLSTTAKVPHQYEFDHDALAFNYRMPNINAALGVAQLEQLSKIIGRQRLLHDRYAEAFAQVTFGELKTEVPGTRANYWLQAYILSPQNSQAKAAVLTTCLDRGISVRPLWKPLNTLGPYRKFPSSQTPVAWDIYSRVVCLPSSAFL